MKYFTKEELEDITKELLENPTRETLKNLNEKYNGSTEVGEVLVKDTPVANTEPPVVDMQTPVVEDKPLVVETPKMVESPVLAPMPTVTEENPIVNSIPNFNIPSMEVPKVENNVNNSVPEMPFFELPKLETPVVNNQNNEPVNFSGNLFEAPSLEMSNLMQTTDNFNSVPNTMPTTEVPVTGAPFFGLNQETVNNPIPVGGPTNPMPNMGPTMFGELQKNYM